MTACKIFCAILLVLILINLSTQDEKLSSNVPKCQFGKSSRKQIDVVPLNGMCMRDMVIHLSKHLYSLSEDELGVAKFQGVLDKLIFADSFTTLTHRLDDLVKSLNDKLKKYTDLLKESNNVIQPILLKQGQDIYSSSQKSDSSNKSTDTCSKIIDALAMNIRNRDWKNLHILPVSQPGTMCGPPSLAHNIGPLLLSQCNRSKNIILLLEQSETLMSEEDVTLAQITAKTIVHMLTETDRVTVIGLAGSGAGLCLDQGLPRATDIHKIRLDRYVDSLMRSTANESFNLDIEKIVKNVTGELVLIHLTNSLNDVSNVKKIYESIKSDKLNVFLRTILILSNQQAHTNIKEYTTNGSIITLPTQHVLGYEIARLFAGLKCAKEDVKPYYLSDPYFEPYSKVMMLSVGQITNTALLSFDVKLSDFVEDLTYFEAGTNHVQAFLLDKRGTLWMHRNFPRMETIVEQPLKVYFHQVENLDEKTMINIGMAEKSEGTAEVTTLLKAKKRLYWKQLDYTELIACLVVSEDVLGGRQNNEEEAILRQGLLKPAQGPMAADLLHHRLDLALASGQLRRDKLCVHAGNKRVASLEVGALYLSGWCFRSASEQARQLGLAARVTVQSYMAYLRDETRLLASPGLRDSVKPEISALGRLLEHFRDRQKESPLGRFIVQRYAAALNSGALLLYPGLVLDSELDPKRRAWYARALEMPSRLVLSPPYLDAGGAGYVITLSRLVHEGRSVGLHSSSDPAFSVLGLDLTLGYIARMLNQLFPLCTENNVKCFLMDEKGFLVYHPALLQPGSKVEQQHLTNNEVLVANDILNHENFVEKLMCASHMDGTSQRYYRFNISLDEVLTNIVHGEHCVKYQLAAVPGTNVFLGVVNITCGSINAFCPCSTMDRSCLNCKRMDQTDCECPCECSLYSSECQLGENAGVSELEPCPAPLEQGSAGLTTPWLQSSATSATLKPCQAFSCQSLSTRSSCLGVVGCQWCELDSDETTLQQPYCADVALCFRGVLGASIPYGDGTYDSQAAEEMMASDWPGVGSVAGLILSFVLVFGMALFCYRLRSVNTGLEHQCLHNSPDTLRMTHLDCELEPADLEPKLSMDSALLRDVVAAPVISPYRVSSNYRRAPQADSDHGYSTMTPHDDSEQHNFSEPLLVLAGSSLKDNNQPAAGINSTNLSMALDFPSTSTSGTIVAPVSPTTNLESSPAHRVIASVTVHHNMETNYC